MPAIAVAMFFLGFLNTNGNVISQSMRQRMVAPGMLGRVGGASRTLGYGLMPLGALLGGFVAEQWGLPAVFVGATVVCVAAVPTRSRWSASAWSTSSSCLPRARREPVEEAALPPAHRDGLDPY